MFNNKPIVPKNSDGVARIISIGRLSQPKATEEATQQSLNAIRRENERLLKTIYSGPSTIRYLGEQISGLVPKRVTMDELWDLVASGEWDLIIAEDLSRIFRNPRFQLAFLQDCVDAGIRVICFADNLDTADENWEAAALIALVRHGLPIPDGRRRIKRTATESFARGGMVMKTRAFYAKVSSDDAASGKYGPKGLRIRKLSDLSWAVDEIRRRIHAGESPRFIVAWLIAEGIPPGDYVVSGKWNIKLFRDLLQDPILHGTRTFRDILYIPIFGSGDYRVEKNAAPDKDYVPELAFMTLEEQEAMLAVLGWSIDWNGPSQRSSPRKGISRYESYWPGQATTCSVCGEKLFACGLYLRCSNSFMRLGGTCWNHVQAPIAPLRRALVEWFVAQSNTSPDFREVLLEAAKRQLHGQRGRRSIQRDALTAKVKDFEAQERNLRKSIRIAGQVSDQEIKALVIDLAAVSKQLRDARCQLESAADPIERLVDYADDEILPNLSKVLGHLLATSFELAEVARGLVPRCVIVPVQSYDTGQVYPRAKLWLRGNMQNYDEFTELVVDLFEAPMYIRIMPNAVRLRSETPKPTLKQIGAQLGVSYMTVKRALGYARLMQQLCVTESFRELQEKPTNASRWRDAS